MSLLSAVQDANVGILKTETAPNEEVSIFGSARPKSLAEKLDRTS